MNKKFWATAFTLTGTIIGAGILGLPYVFAKSGVLIGLFWLVIIGFIVMYLNLCLSEVALRTKGRHHLAGYAEIYLGKKAEWVMFLAAAFGIYSALLAYLIGEGQSLSRLFTGRVEYSIYFALGFWLIMTLLLREGLRGLKKIETWGVVIIIILILTIAGYYSPEINTQNYAGNNFSYLFFPFGVILFALMGFTSIPELRMEIKGNERKLKKAILIGSGIPIVLYAIFSLVFVGVLGKEVPEVATLGFGNLVLLLGVFTMLTSYFVLSFSLKDIFTYDIKKSKRTRTILVSVVPLIAYLLLYYFDKLNFVSVLGIGGVISGGIGGILILLTAFKAKKMGKRKPEYEIPMNWFWIGLISLIFIMGIVVEIGS